MQKKTEAVNSFEANKSKSCHKQHLSKLTGGSLNHKARPPADSVYLLSTYLHLHAVAVSLMCGVHNVKLSVV